MAETSYIKSVTFGGYDKTEVKNRFNEFYIQIYDLQDELRTTKQLLAEFQKGTDAQKANDAVLSDERAKLVHVQAQNELLKSELNDVRSLCESSVSENEKLKSEVAKLQRQLTEANSKLSALNGDSVAAISRVFIEAQKSADMIVDDAQKSAADVGSNCKQIAESMIEAANNDAARIVLDAEKTAAEKIANAEAMNEQLQITSNDLRASMSNDVKSVRDDVEKTRLMLESMLAKISESETLLDETSRSLESGSAPVLKHSAKFVPDLDLPKLPTAISHKSSKKSAKGINQSEEERKNELDAMLALANSLNS